RSWRSGSPADDVVAPQAVPEGSHAVEHLAGTREELLAVESRGVERLGELVRRVRSVLVLDLVVPGPEAERQLRTLPHLARPEACDELLPEPSGRPVLDRVGRSLGNRGIVAAVDPDQLVAEEQRARRGMPPLAHVLETQSQRAAKPHEPFEVAGGETEPAPIDGPLGPDDVRVHDLAVIVACGSRLTAALANGGRRGPE